MLQYNTLKINFSDDLPSADTILGGVRYIVSGSDTGKVVYNGVQYSEGDAFWGIRGISTYYYIYGAVLLKQQGYINLEIRGEANPYFVSENNVDDVLSNGKGFPENTLLKYLPDPLNKQFLNTLTGYEDNLTYAELDAFITANSEITADIDANNTINNILYSFTEVGTLTEVYKMFLKNVSNLCKPFVFFAWINKFGVFEYELFLRRKEETVLTKNETALGSSGELSFASQSRETFQIFKNNIDIQHKERYQDLMKSCANDVFLWKREFITGSVSITDYDTTISSALLFTCSEKHGLQTGDQITTDITNYNSNTYTIVVIDEYNFYAIGSYVSDGSGNWNLIINEKMWELVQCKSLSDSINTYNKTFNISFEIFKPSII